MRVGGQRIDLAIYWQALPVYARNLGVLLGPLVAATAAWAIDNYAQGPLFYGVGGSGGALWGYIVRVVQFLGFAYALIFADDAWRFGHGDLGRAWNEFRRKIGPILLAIIGFLFIVYVAELVGGFAGLIGLAVVGALAVWAFLWSIPAAALGGIPGGAAFSASLNIAKRNWLATIVVAVVGIVVYMGLAVYALNAVGNYYVGVGYDVTSILLPSIALGYIALVAAKQYSDLAFRAY